MCDYCDCRTRPLLARLGQDHEEIAVAAHRLREAVDDADTERRMAAADELVHLLEPHARTEEAGLYPELTTAGVPTGEMEAEHRTVDSVLAAAARPGAVDATAVITALDALDDHIHREEYDLFPAAHQVLDDAGWDRLDASWDPPVG